MLGPLGSRSARPSRAPGEEELPRRSPARPPRAPSIKARSCGRRARARLRALPRRLLRAPSLPPPAMAADPRRLPALRLLPLLPLLLLAGAGAPAAAAAPPGPPCPALCERTRCPPRSPQSCLAVGGELQPDRCGCCWECAPGEGQPCAPGGLCAQGLFCRRPAGSRLARGTCLCPDAALPVCGSDGRTYRSLCQLRAENKQGRLRDQAPVVAVQKGGCGQAGKGGAAGASAEPSTPGSGAGGASLARAGAARSELQPAPRARSVAVEQERQLPTGVCWNPSWKRRIFEEPVQSARLSPAVAKRWCVPPNGVVGRL